MNAPVFQNTAYVPEIERAVLGSMMFGAAKSEAVDILKDYHFVEPIHQHIFRAIKTATERYSSSNAVVVKRLIPEDAAANFEKVSGIKISEYLSSVLGDAVVGARLPIDATKRIIEQWARLSIANEAEEEAEGEDGEEAEAEPLLANPDMVIEIDGNKVPVRELMDGYLREADYTRSKQAVVHERTQLQELGKNFQGALDRVVDYLTAKLPPEPDPQLAYTNPQAHYQMKVLYDAALAEMQGILGMKHGTEEANNLLSETDFKARMSAENENLIKKMPHLKDQKRLDAFNRKVTEGAKAYGISDEEITASDIWLADSMSGNALDNPEWTVIGSSIYVTPTVPSGETLKYFYIKKLTAFAADTDDS